MVLLRCVLSVTQPCLCAFVLPLQLWAPRPGRGGRAGSPVLFCAAPKGVFPKFRSFR